MPTLRIPTRIASAAMFALLLVLLGGWWSSAFAHHGWRWTSDGAFEVTGTIEKAVLGNPHGVLTLDVDGQKWVAEVGQPWRHQRVGLADDMLVKGVTLTIVGKRSAEAGELRVKAERVIIGKRKFDLYPDRLAD